MERVDRRASGETGEDELQPLAPNKSFRYVPHLNFRVNTLLQLELVHKSELTLVSLRDQRF